MRNNMNIKMYQIWIKKYKSGTDLYILRCSTYMKS